MPASKYDILIQQGATEGLTFQLYQADGTTPRNISGYNARMQIRKRPSDSTAIWSGTSNPAAGITITGNPGAVAVRFEAAATAAMRPDTYVYDLELVAGNGDVERLIEGNVIVSPEVTRN